MNTKFKRTCLFVLALCILIMPGCGHTEPAPAPTAAPEANSATLPPPTAVPSAEAARPSSTQPPQTAESGVLRVLLTQLKEPAALGMTLEGSYSVEGDSGFRFADGSQISVALDGENLLLTSGGLTINMGKSLSLTRHESEVDGGIWIHEAGKNLFVGDLTLSAADGKIEPVLHINVEEYLYGVVPYEMSDSFPLEALKAQAVAARTYALDRRSKAAARSYDVVDSTADQVYKGYNPDYENAIAAVDETAGVVGMYNGNFAQCYFTASNGGQSELATDIWGGEGDFGYLKMVDDPYDVENPSSEERKLTVPIDGAQMNKDLSSLLKGKMGDQLKGQGLSPDSKDIEILSVDGVEGHSPLHQSEGCRMYTQMRFALTVKALPLPTPEPTVQADAPADGLQDKNASSDELAADALQPTEAPQPTPAPINIPVVVDLSVYDELKPGFGLKINASDYELMSVEKLYAPAQTEPENQSDQAPQGQPGEAAETPAPTPTPQLQAYEIIARRFGHGVGMSQRGAQQMAAAHSWDYEQILSFYYPGMALEQKVMEAPPLPPLAEIAKNVGRARPQPTPQPTPQPLPALQEGEEYAKVALASKGSTLNVREEPSTSAAIRGVLLNGQRVIVVGQSEDGWHQIKTVELQGYVSSEFLQLEN